MSTMHVEEYIIHARHAEENLTRALEKIIEKHPFENDIVEMCQRFKHWSNQHVTSLNAAGLSEKGIGGTELFELLFSKNTSDPYGLLRDLHALALLFQDSFMAWTILGQAAKAMRNETLDNVCKEAEAHLNKEMLWIVTRAKNAAVQVLVVG